METLQQLKGTGPRGLIMKADVLDFIHKKIQPEQIQQQIKQQQTPLVQKIVGKNKYTEIPMSEQQIKNAIMFNKSKNQIPHYYLNCKIYTDKINNLLNEINKQGTKIELQDILIKIAALSTKNIQEINHSWQENKINIFQNFDLQLDAQNGFNPVIQNIGKKSLQQINKERQVAIFQFQIVNESNQNGTFAFRYSDIVENIQDIISIPHSCILSVGKAQNEVYIDEKNQLNKKQFRNIDLSCDHRTVDGAVGALWLKQFAALVHNPDSILI